MGEVTSIKRKLQANDQSGFIGVAIVGAFLLIVVGWYGGRWAMRKLGRKQEQEE